MLKITVPLMTTKLLYIILAQLSVKLQFLTSDQKFEEIIITHCPDN